jgi:formiminoglutamase
MFNAPQYQPPSLKFWRGRNDSAEGPLAVRWHQRIFPFDLRKVKLAPGSRALLGFASDTGVARNYGRIGAAQGPAALRLALAHLAWHATQPACDAGDIVCQDDDLEAAQAALGTAVARLLEQRALPIVLGGGHEVAYGTWLGIAGWAMEQATMPRIGIVNFDAHFDMRSGRANSGTPFRQIADACTERGWPFAYACFGVSRASNTAALFERARERGVTFVLDEELVPWKLEAARERLAAFMRDVDVLQLSMCLDVLPAAQAPGVSAPAARGVDYMLIEPLIDDVLASGKVIAAEVAELNPHQDIDAHTARIAARIVERVARGAAPATWMSSARE